MGGREGENMYNNCQRRGNVDILNGETLYQEFKTICSRMSCVTRE